jgi:hypothetical protein
VLLVSTRAVLNGLLDFDIRKRSILLLLLLHLRLVISSDRTVDHRESLDAIRVPPIVAISIEDVPSSFVESGLRFSCGRISVAESFFSILGFDLWTHGEEHVIELRRVGRILSVESRNEGRDVSLMVDVTLKNDEGS